MIISYISLLSMSILIGPIYGLAHHFFNRAGYPKLQSFVNHLSTFQQSFFNVMALFTIAVHTSALVLCFQRLILYDRSLSLYLCQALSISFMCLIFSLASYQYRRAFICISLAISLALPSYVSAAYTYRYMGFEADEFVDLCYANYHLGIAPSMRFHLFIPLIVFVSGVSVSFFLSFSGLQTSKYHEVFKAPYANLHGCLLDRRHHLLLAQVHAIQIESGRACGRRV